MRTRNINPIKKRAFTLIELLVVIAIIGLLASIVLIALNSARAKSRMAARVGTLKQLTSALELYYNDHNGYPASGGGWVTSCDGNHTANTVIPGLTPTYVSALNADPLATCTGGGNGTNFYAYNSNGTDYKFEITFLTDITAAQVISNYPTYADPNRMAGYNPDGCGGGPPFVATTLAIWTSGYACQ
jgi:prepilin-type N-terminal cleavage/methylation domain-containing protein